MSKNKRKIIASIVLILILLITGIVRADKPVTTNEPVPSEPSTTQEVVEEEPIAEEPEPAKEPEPTPLPKVTEVEVPQSKPVVTPPPAPEPQGPAIHDIVNRVRASHGLKPVRYNLQLQGSAQAKCNDMQVHNYWDHNRPGMPWTAFFNFRYSNIGENLARGYASDEATVQGWLDSPSHRDNMLSNWDYVGYAHCSGNIEGLVVQHFMK